MSDPRNVLQYDGINPEYVTFDIDASTITYSATAENGSDAAGMAVTLSGGKTVALAGDGEAVIGKLLSVEADGKAIVQTGGYMVLPAGTGATLTVGNKIVGDLDASSNKGYIRAVNTAVAAELGVADGKIIDATDSTAVVVKL